MRFPRPGRPVARPLRLAVAATLAAGLLLTACGSDDDPAPGAAGAGTGATEKPVAGGSVTYAIDTEPTCFDIHVSPQDITAAIQRNVFDSLVAEDESGTFHPWLASSWETSPDLKTYTFKLRQDVTFTDGTRFDAAAVKANFDHIKAPTTKSRYAASLLGSYTGTDVVDQFTARVNFAQPFAPFLQAASTAYLGFYSPKTLAADADKLCGGGPVAVGTGPFTFTSYTKGQSIVLTKNPAYNWAPATAKHTGAAYLDTLTIRVLKENSTRIGSLTSGQIDVAGAVPPANVAAVEANGRLQVLRRDAAGSPYSLYLNTTLAPFTDERVRVAFQRGLNIDQDVKTVYFGQYKRSWSPLTAVTPSYDRSLENSWPYDPAKANQLLDEAGWTGRDSDGYRTRDGHRLTVAWPIIPATIREQRDVLGQAFQEDLKKIGIELTRPSLDAGTYLKEAYAGKYAVLDFSWARFEPDVLRLFFHSASTLAGGGQNAAFVKDPEVDTWTTTGAGTFDEKVRNDVYARTQQRVVRIGAVVPVYTPSSILAAGRHVHGIAFDTNAWPQFYDAWRDRK
ncbi:peptide/nickel transport system substrate-binding protein [Parafrankia irregularis]|uniref:Peptide/nickel transport system substrate-binding protein n=1 Tax=Parafrankia irregularis TaxID=795642 RepID=A0A0S4QRL6_9ACTN|nr:MULTISPECIES: ABC transporter substrate-binding protein [Parafrankia]MBE3205845.1 ABC transporter substrate-binding protein [Parafrankia sp. CH37]CUU58209.1 peptide/nickel transport system substrate-binding protein [Parafrankia irregularis]